MTFRADGTSVVNVVDGHPSGVALAFDPAMARQIAEALNKHLPGAGGRGKVDPLTGETVERLDVTDQRMLSDVIGKGKLVKVTGPYATAMMGTPDGRQVRSLAQGAVLPGDVTAGNARHLIDVGLAEVVKASTAQQAQTAKPATGEQGDPQTSGQPATQTGGDSGQAPRANASRDDWAAYATSKGAPETETLPVDQGGLSRDDLRAKYGA